MLGNLQPIASLPGEIVVTHNEWYDYEAKYDEGEMDLVVPARVTDEQIERAQELAVRAFVATDCEGMARADLFVRADGEVLVNELNTIPGFTSTSVYARLFEASGIAVRRAAAAARRPRRRALRAPAVSCASCLNHVAAARDAPPALSDGRRAAFDALLARTPGGGDVDYDLPQPKWWFLHHLAAAASCCTARTSTRSTSSARAQNFDAHTAAASTRSSRPTTRSGRSTSPSSTVRSPRATSTGASTSAPARRATCSRSAPTRATRALDDRDDLRPAARDVRADPGEAGSSSASCRCGRARG